MGESEEARKAGRESWRECVIRKALTTNDLNWFLDTHCKFRAKVEYPQQQSASQSHLQNQTMHFPVLRTNPTEE